MKFGTRLILSMVGPVVLLIIGFGYIDEHRTQKHFLDELRREGRVISRAVQLALEDALRDRNFSIIEELVEQITGFEGIYGLRLTSPDGTILYQSDVLRSESLAPPETLSGVLASRKPAEFRETIGGQKVLTYVSPLTAPDGSSYGTLQLLQLESFIEEEARSARNGIFALSLIMILVTSGVIIIVTRLVVNRPLGEFIERIRTIDPMDSQARAPVRGGDELKRLAREFNALWMRLADAHASLLAAQADKRRAESRLRNAERMAALGEMAAGLAHEIGTPLNVIGGRTDLLIRRGGVSAADEKNLTIISQQLNRIARIVRDMLDFGRVKELRPEPVDLDELVTSVLEFLDHRLEQAGVRVERHLLGEPRGITVDPDQIYQVLLNLFLNAIDSMKAGGLLRVSMARVNRAHPDSGAAPEEFMTVRIEDNGSGITPENLERIFDPFFTTKRFGDASGLGLSVAWGIAREHGGWIEAASLVGHGTTMTLFLPTAARAILRQDSEGVSA